MSIEEALKVITDSIRELRVPYKEGGIVRNGFENLATGKGAFIKNMELKELIIPDSVEVIGKHLCYM